MIKDLVRKNRSYRRFFQDFLIDSKTLLDLIDLVRLTATGANKQSLRFKLINKSPETEKVFSCLSWAGYLQDWNGPAEGEKPSAYIIILNDPEIKEKPQYDVGLACQSILLGAVEKELGGCIFGSVKRDHLKKILNLPPELDIMLVLALGKPKEEVVIADVENDNIKYWRDEDGKHYVPKRKLEDIIL
ncbi:MAG: nitroreductase family protein [Candidatus Cloacimonetes bacterium]|nr:nitroreductase family protein [Candidatus Cloacimonadota bacterium]MCF7814220.1 nitroreductase family protein [Candidatus Cloacimonadota bacterium]MCF7868121.1 nitroreductase family protein [Candidatus Cloacimonadota bacterium]MCF7883587.1 nitroreductase family protein [Candidatus Cloacimonadota bacterium]